MEMGVKKRERGGGEGVAGSGDEDVLEGEGKDRKGRWRRG